MTRKYSIKSYTSAELSALRKKRGRDFTDSAKAARACPAPKLGAEFWRKARIVYPDGRVVKLDLSPAVLAEYGARRATGGRKAPIAARIDRDVVDWLKSFGPGYLTRMNAILRECMQAAGRSEQRKPQRSRRRADPTS